jgi:hypothetical protein
VKPRTPPTLATWLLTRLGDRYRRDALLGDLMEEHRWGRSNAWYWLQVLHALIAGAGNGLRMRWPGIALVVSWWMVLLGLSFACHWPVIIFALDPSLFWLHVRRKRRLRLARSARSSELS